MVQKCTNILIWGVRIIAKIGQDFFLRLFVLAPVFFSRPFYSRYLLRFIVFLNAVKLGVDYGQSLEMEP